VIASPPKKTCQLPLFSAFPAAVAATVWAIERVPAGVAIASDRFWLVCGAWHYCLQFTGQEADLLVALLTRWDWLDWRLDDRGCPACIGILHGAIEQLISASAGDRGVAAC
jgi:hypothetical protein